MQTPCVADLCEAILDRRFLLEERFEDVRGEILAMLDELAEQDTDFRYETKDLMTVYPVQADKDCRLVREVSGAIRDIVGVEPPLIASPGTYDQKHVMRLGLVDQCIAYGPGLLHMSHQPDEYCVIDDLIAATKVMAITALRLLNQSSINQTGGA